MPIYIEQDMNDFCERVKSKGFPFALVLEDEYPGISKCYEDLNAHFIDIGILGDGSHLQQRIKEVHFGQMQDSPAVFFENYPCLYPSPKILSEHPTTTGPMTGNLSNCYDPNNKFFLFHMRGRDISAPFGFQAAAAGMGQYGEHPGITAKKELSEEAGIDNPKTLFNGYATDVLPFMKAGKIPQPLFSFGFLSVDLTRFSNCRSIDEIAEFETATKQKLESGELEKKEGYHFTIPLKSVETIVGELHDQKRFYGPIAESHTNFHSALKDYEYLN